ncbi:cytochrome c oxidase accessory protein CcoG [Luteolibacter yonseiensis]|uniref:cytochrome c oxidase accessory protein CcoG n=1 Tax=Luteolibacter yonseiensis TaxID=1144680 RepID=UPI002D7FD734|nr:cytochrome c oxidase accessory protein CcoG [Luteolibacter yonseiensis]
MPVTRTSLKRPNLVSVTTINADGSHHVLHPADVRGKFTRARRAFAGLLIAVYVALPWLTVNGAPAVLFDIERRRFHFFGLTLLAQDLWVLFFLISGLGFLLFFITAILGRLWCGWACPYTVFLDHVFRRIERWTDGDASARRRLAAAPFTASKITRRAVKHALFILVSTLLAHVFLSYFVPLPRLYQFMLHSPLANAGAFGTVALLTGALFYCFGFFREQFCIILCPYGRIQSALTDEDTVVIGYDAKRGEPRGKATNPNAGSCVDCTRCVQVCPTGIDIRNGLQMECIGCAACIDACDDIMIKLKRPTGLVRYDSTRGLAGKKRRIIRPRILVYLLLGFLGLVALGAVAFQRAKPVFAEVSRMRGPSFYTDASTIRNHYQLRLVNKRNQTVRMKITLENPPAGFTTSGAGETVSLDALGEISRPLVILQGRQSYKGPSEITILIHAEPGDSTIRQSLKFLGPNPQSLK